MDDFGLLVGIYNAALPTLSDGAPNTLQLDSSGRLIIAGQFSEDAAHSSSDAGLHILAVRNDVEGALAGTDGDYASLQVDASGRLRVIADIDVGSNTEYAEDSAHTTADSGNFILAVRQDTKASTAGTDGDYAALIQDADGDLYVSDTVSQSSLSSIDTSLNNIETDISALTKAEDSAHISSDSGIMALAVRQDADAALGADGDYAPLQVDADGKLKVASGIKGDESYNATDDLVAAADGLVSVNAYTDVVSIAHTSGTAYIYGFSWDCDKNAVMRIITDTSGAIVVYKTRLNSSSSPGNSEHFSEGGRIEIAGAAGKSIKLQVQTRAATAGNAAGSMHVRK